MAQDIRKMIREDRDLSSEKMQKDHQQRFEAKLEEAFPQNASEEKKKNGYFFMKIAAVMIVALGVSMFFLVPTNWNDGEQVVENPAVEQHEEEVIPEKEYRLSEFSPEFKKVEDYYLASLNIELAKLDVNQNNKALVDAFMEQLSGLDKEYKRLNAEINQNGLSEQSVEAMIGNLQLRLELLYKLKNKINEINQTKNKEYENFQA